MRKKQQKVPFEVHGNGHSGVYMARNASHAVSKFRKRFHLPVDRTHSDYIWHGLSVSAVNEVVHYPK